MRKLLNSGIVMMMLLGVLMLFSPIKANAVDLKLTTDMTKTSTELAAYGKVDLNGNTLTVIGDYNLGNKLYLNGGTLIVNGNMIATNYFGGDVGRAIINGNYTQKSGQMYVNSTVKINISGDLNIIGSGHIDSVWLSSKDAVVTVGKNINYSSSNNSECSYPAFNVGGNIIQEPNTGRMALGVVTLQGNSQKVILQANGDFRGFTPGEGTLTLGKYMNLGSINGDIDPVFEGDTLTINYDTTINNNANIRGNLIANAEVSMKAKSDVTVGGNLEANGKIGVLGGAFTVNGNVLATKEFHNDNGRATIKGNYTQKTSYLRVDHASKTDIKGDFNLIGSGRMEFSWDDSKASVVTIGKNINYSSSADTNRCYPDIHVGGNIIQEPNTGKMNLDYVYMENLGTKVVLTKGTLGTLTVYHGIDKYDIPQEYYKTLKVICDITFDANGGNLEGGPIVVKTGDRIANMPSATREGYIFEGWYTNNIAGDKIEKGTTSSFLKDTTLYAHWKMEENGEVKAFVNRLYKILLDRDADTIGLNDWSNRLVSGEAKAAQIVEGIVNSEEYNLKGLSHAESVERMYQAMLGRPSDEGGMKDWKEKLDNGLSLNYIINGFSGSPEFGSICKEYRIEAGTITLGEPRDQNKGIAAFVARCYVKALGRDYEKDGINDWCNQILSAVNKKQRAEEVASDGFFHSQEFANKNTSNDEYVEILYRTFLGREYDEAGKADWVGKLNSGVSRDDVLYGFSRSAEFANIMSQYGL